MICTIWICANTFVSADSSFGPTYDDQDFEMESHIPSFDPCDKASSRASLGTSLLCLTLGVFDFFGFERDFFGFAVPSCFSVFLFVGFFLLPGDF